MAQRIMFLGHSITANNIQAREKMFFYYTTGLLVCEISMLKFITTIFFKKMKL